MSRLPAYARIGLVALALIAIAWPQATRSNVPGLAGTNWRIVEIGQHAVDAGGTITFTANRVSGSTGCNRFFASLDVTADRMTIGPIATTRMFCGPQMVVERETLQALARVATARRDGARIALHDAAGVVVMLLDR